MWKRVIAPTAVVSIIWIAVSSVTTSHMNALYESQSRAISEDVSTIESAWAMRRDVWKLQSAVLEAKHIAPTAQQARLASLIETFARNLDDARKTSLTSPERALVKSIEEKFNRYRDEVDRDLAGTTSGQSDNAAAQSNRLSELAIDVASACAQLVELNERMIQEASATNARTHHWVSFLRITFLVLGPLLGLLLGLITARRLNRSISQISVTLEDASGKLGHELGSVAVTETDQLPVLQRQVDFIARQIRTVVGELEQTRRLAIQSERLAALGELAAGVAHEIRNPLTSIKLLIQTASERHPQAAMNEKQVAVVLQEISRMESMIQGLLDFAKPPQLRMVVHDLRQTVRRALNLVHGRARHQCVEVSERMPSEALWVNADPEQLHMVFVNLAINALEAMPEGGTLNVAVSASNTSAIVVFRDSGKGIPPELLERIFEPFVTNKERGTGLGLAICQRVITEHFGSLRAVNHADGGAVLTVELPRDTSGAGATAESSDAQEVRSYQSPAFARHRTGELS